MRINALKLGHVFLIGILVLATNAFASERATREDAIAFVKKATAYIKTHGKEKALAEFNNPKGQFVDRELFIVAVDLNGTVLANGHLPKLAGKNLMDFRDVNGKYFVKEEIELAKTKGKGWVDFEFNNPETKKIEPRSVYLERVDDYLINAGVYNAK